MGNLPKVTVLYANGGLLKSISAVDGIVGIVGTGTTSGLLGVPCTVYSLDDAIAQGFTELAEPAMYRHLLEFYNEVGGSQELHIMIVPDTMTLAQMVTESNASGAKKLVNDAQGKVRILGVYRKPASGYSGGADFIDSDVGAALLTAKTFAQTRLAENRPLRVLVEGRVQNFAAANTLTPTESANGFAGVVLGGTLNDGSASVGLALGRAVKYSAHIKIGKVANGPLSITSCFVGNKDLKLVTNLDTLHGAGFISFMQHPQKAGFYFGIDRMASTDDYRLLAYGRIVDKAAIIAAATYIEELEGETEIDSNGNIATDELSNLEKTIEQQINALMADQISELIVYINPAQNLINSGKLTVKLRVRPLGYKSFIDVDLGLTA